MNVASAQLTELIAADIAGVEAAIEKLIGSNIALVQQVSSHTFRAGGKRLRPALVAMSARCVESDIDLQRVYRLGACMELIHMATLVHDDVIDHAATRRGLPTAAVVFGNTASILSGDVMLARAMSELARDGDLEVIRTVSAAVVELAEGELAELEARGNFLLTEVELLRVLRMKTASIIQCCCSVGSLAGGGTSQQCNALAQYGSQIGLAFQIIDDLIDYEGDPAVTGKPAGTDFREGSVTLPLIFLRESLQSTELDELRSLFGTDVNVSEFEQVKNWMYESRAFERTRAAASGAIEKAIRSLDALDPSAHRTALASVGNFILERSA